MRLDLLMAGLILVATPTAFYSTVTEQTQAVVGALRVESQVPLPPIPVGSQGSSGKRDTGAIFHCSAGLVLGD